MSYKSDITGEKTSLIEEEIHYGCKGKETCNQ